MDKPRHHRKDVVKERECKQYKWFRHLQDKKNCIGGYYGISKCIAV